ncbi:MAG: phosphoribosylamine--glycine ligase [Candidatus Acidiferrum sp.]
MKVLVIGGGGREHALIWKLKQSAHVEKIWCAPGNGGIASEAECIPVDVGDVAALAALAEKLSPDLTIVGPELPLVNGIADIFAARNWPLVGPSRQAAQLEGSKIFTKQFLKRHGIATAKLYGAFDSPGDAYAALEKVQWPLVIKADGLCAGKGVFLAPDKAAAKDFIERVMEKNELGSGGQRIMLEETLIGDELSFIILTDGKQFAPMVPTRDHKRVYDGNKGPNTGGMGAYSSDELLPTPLRKTILAEIVEPSLHGLAADNIPYQGFLYFGLMLTKDGPKVLEFNCRLGDPETQAIVARMDFDLAELLAGVAVAKFDPSILKWKPGASACVVLTAGGYPGKYATGDRVELLTVLNSKTGVKVLHAGTRLEGDFIVTNGGRVLGLVASGDSLETALSSVYEAVQKIHFEGMHYRKDIGSHALENRAVGD